MVEIKFSSHMGKELQLGFKSTACSTHRTTPNSSRKVFYIRRLLVSEVLYVESKTRVFRVTKVAFFQPMGSSGGQVQSFGLKSAIKSTAISLRLFLMILLCGI